jgi:hypothetical protein
MEASSIKNGELKPYLLAIAIGLSCSALVLLAHVLGVALHHTP